METLIDCTEPVSYNEIDILVHWKKCRLKMKNPISILEEYTDTIMVEKEYIIFDYSNYRVSDSYISDEYTYGYAARVKELCSMIDNGNFDELKAMKVKLERIE